MDALNRNTQAAVTDERPKARFRIRDISIKKMYSNDANFYSMQDIEQLAQKIYAVGLLENLTVVHDPCDRGEYRIIAGERRWRALNLLVERGYKEFEIASCQVKTPAEEHEEMVSRISSREPEKLMKIGRKCGNQSGNRKKRSKRICTKIQGTGRHHG